MQQVVRYDFKGQGVRTVAVKGEIWWVAKDVCQVLGLKRSATALTRLRPSERGVHTMDTPSSKQPLSIISESGLYKLIMTSRIPAAEEFQDWVTCEVLPAIRRSGTYAITQRDPFTEVDRVAATLLSYVPAAEARTAAIEVRMGTHDQRLAAIEEKQRQTDPREIERRVAVLHEIKEALVAATRAQPMPVTYRGYWRTLGRLLGVASFQHRAALTVSGLDLAIEHARQWLKTRSVGGTAGSSLKVAE